MKKLYAYPLAGGRMSKVLDFKKNQASFRVSNKTATKAEIILYGAIGASWFEDSITAKSFSEELKKLDANVKEITVRINSPGGDVFDGVTIYNRLKQHPAKVTVIVDGLAASIASIIALAGDEIIMSEGALYMIHLPWTMAAGNRNDLDNTIDRLLDVENQLVSIYANKTKMSKNEIRSMLEKETWLDSSQTVEMGFADKTSEEAMPIAASVFDKATWINKRPTTYKSEAQVVKKEIENLKQKISGFLARR